MNSFAKRESITCSVTLSDDLLGSNIDLSDYTVDTALDTAIKQTVKITVMNRDTGEVQTSANSVLLDSVAAYRHPSSTLTNTAYYTINYGLTTAGTYVMQFWYDSISSTTSGRRKARAEKSVEFVVREDTAYDQP